MIHTPSFFCVLGGPSDPSLRACSPATLLRMSVAVGFLRSFLDVARRSFLSELAEDLAYYEGVVASLLQVMQSSGESLSSVGPKVARALMLCEERTHLSEGSALGVAERILLGRKATLESEYSAIY